MFKSSIFALATILLAVVIAFVSADNFDLQRAILGVYLSKVSYCDVGNIKDWSCPVCTAKFPGVTNVTAVNIELHASQGWTGYDQRSNTIFLAFRGTVDLTGWIEDFDFFAVDYEKYEPNSNCKDCKVMQGLFLGWLDMRKTLLPALQALVRQYPNADLMLAGHSMGASQIAYAYPDVVRHSGTKGKIYMYNYGCPREGNDKYAKWIDTVVRPMAGENSFRCTNRGDPIVHLPFVAFDKFGLGQWIHSQREVFWKNNFGPAQDYKICNGTWDREDPTCADSTPIWAFNFDHHTTYLDIGLGCFV